VLFDRLKGVLPETSGEGTHFLVPWLQQAVIFDIRTRPRSISSVTGTKGATRRRAPRCAHAAQRSAPHAAAPFARGGASGAAAARAGWSALDVPKAVDVALTPRAPVARRLAAGEPDAARAVAARGGAAAAHLLGAAPRRAQRHCGRALALTRLRARSQQLGEDFDERVLPSIANEVLKAVVVRAACDGIACPLPVSLTPPAPRPNRRSSTRTSC
jgi:hypothetical protein